MKNRLALASSVCLGLGLLACGDDSTAEHPEIEAGADDTSEDDDVDDISEDDDVDDVSEDDDTDDDPLVDDTDDNTVDDVDDDTDDDHLTDDHEHVDGGADAGEDHGHSNDAMCEDLGQLCHDFDTGEGMGHECHEVGHAGDADECAAIYDECIAFCQEPAEAGVDAGDDHHGEGSAMCEEMGHLCHDLDDGEGLAHECHEVGHAGDADECAEIYDECIALCQGDGGSHSHMEAGPELQPFELRFVAMANDEVVDCTTPFTAQVPVELAGDAGAGSADGGDAGARDAGSPFPGVGDSVTVSVADLRFYVSDLRFYDDQGVEVPVTLDESEFQYHSDVGSVALVDLTGNTEGSCAESAIAFAEGTARQNPSVTGLTDLARVASVAFSVGVPQAVMQDVIANNDIEGAPSPLGEMYWSWASGYRHFVFNAALETATDLMGEGYMHVGSRACGPADGLALEDRDSCDFVNTPAVMLPAFDLASDSVVVDLGAIVDGLDFVSDVRDPDTMEVIGQQPGVSCHSSPMQPDCELIFGKFGVDIDTGVSNADDNVVFYRQ